jgi:hypothetical protein
MIVRVVGDEQCGIGERCCVDVEEWCRREEVGRRRRSEDVEGSKQKRMTNEDMSFERHVNARMPHASQFQLVTPLQSHLTLTLSKVKVGKVLAASSVW